MKTKVTALFIPIICLVVYANSLTGEFIMDDWPVIAENPYLGDLRHLPGYFNSGVWDNTGIPGEKDDYLYRPVFLTVLFLAYQSFGTQTPGYHAINLALHITNSLLVFFLALRINKSMSTSAPLKNPGVGAVSMENSHSSVIAPTLATILFAIHPVQSESVSWIAGVTDPLVTVFLLGSFLTFIRYSESGKPAALLLSASCFILALLTKETAVMLPVILIAWLAFNPRTILRDKRQLVSLGLFFSILTGYFIARKLALGNTIALSNFSGDGLITLFLFLAEYIKLLFVPWPINYYYAVPEQGVLQAWGGSVAILVITATVYALRNRSQRPVLLFSIAWIALTLLPSLSLAFHENPGFSIRFLYLPSIGLALFAATLLAPLVDKYKPQTLAACVIVFVTFSAITINANKHWHDEVTFYTHAQQVTPKHAGPVSGLAKYYQRNNQPGKAIDYYLQTADLGNKHVKSIAFENIGLIYGMQGNVLKSTEFYERAYSLAPKRSTILVGLGNNAWSRKDMQAALSYYTQAYQVDNRNYEAAYNLSLLYRDMGDINRAAFYQQKAQQVSPAVPHK